MTTREAKRVGHMGAGHLAPGNTRASFDAALRAGVDAVEFDVLPERRDGDGALVLAHDFEDAGARTPLTLEEGLEHFAQDAWADVELILDLKLPGHERRAVDALGDAGLTARTLVSTTDPGSLRALRALTPPPRVGWSVRRVLPARARQAIRERRIGALMAHWTLVTPRLVDAVIGAGGELYAWTVDDRNQIAALERLGVTGIVTNDPRLFGARAHRR